MWPPVATETVGTWNQVAVKLLQEIGRRITMVTEDTRETAFLFQRLSIALCSSTGKCGLLYQRSLPPNKHPLQAFLSFIF